MLRKILFLLIYLFTWVIFFELARVCFLLATSAYAKDASTGLLFQSLWYGLRMDISAAAYITVPVCLFVLLSVWLPFFRRRIIYFIYTGILLFTELLLVLIDTEAYKAWGSRLDFSALRFLSSPKEVWASVSHLPVIWMLLGFLVVYILIFWVFRKVISHSVVFLATNTYRFVQTLVLALFTIAFIVPIRGGLQLAPINQSAVYFSDNQYANLAAVNASWNFMQSVTKSKYLSHNLYEYLGEQEADTVLKDLFAASGKVENIMHDTAALKPNVIVIIWESFTQKALDITIAGKPVFRYFPELAREGIYFSNCYASGDRTDKGISAVLSSYPALPKESIVNYTGKTTRLGGMGNIFSQNGYSTSFYYGGEPEFMNIKTYLQSQRFQQLISKDDFKEEDMNSKWGAHDEVVMKRLLSDIGSMQQPFFTSWLTLSSHEPFETPVPKVFAGNNKETKFFNSLHYTDSVIYTFINELKKLPSWKNTLVIISADHGHYLPVTGKRADDYRIPVLWLGGFLKKQNEIINKTTSQLDVAASLMQQLNFTDTLFPFSKNVFDSSARHWAFFTYNDGIGYVTDSSRLLFDNAGRKVVFREGKTSPADEKIARALMQKLYSDFLKR
jgi:phosphoglycerol transferase MdoB-like AlkP superfamily enzyme